MIKVKFDRSCFVLGRWAVLGTLVSLFGIKNSLSKIFKIGIWKVIIVFIQFTGYQNTLVNWIRQGRWKNGILSLSDESCSPITLLMHSTHACCILKKLTSSISSICQHNTTPRGVETKYRSKSVPLANLSKQWCKMRWITKSVLRPKIKVTSILIKHSVFKL